MKTFKDLEFVPHSAGMEGVMSRIQFDNGYGASVVKAHSVMVVIGDCMNWRCWIVKVS
jgi:hypothetical protein